MIDGAEAAVKVEAVVPQVVGFLEESKGVKSSSRLAMFIVLGLIGAVTAAFVAYVFTVKAPSSWAIGSFAGMVTALCGCGGWIHSNRT